MRKSRVTVAADPFTITRRHAPLPGIYRISGTDVRVVQGLVSFDPLSVSSGQPPVENCAP